MKYKTLLFSAIFLVCLAGSSQAQISNLEVNGSRTFTVTAGDTLGWSYNIPVGSTATIQIWYDVDKNTLIDPSKDVLFQTITQTDGDSVGQNGPPDMDGKANGTVYFKSLVGIAPGDYVMVFSQGGVSDSAWGKVNPLPSPAHTISGTVTVPAGKSAAYIFVEAARDQQYQPNFWDGVTDSSGHYAIETTADTAGEPWQVRIVNNPFAHSVVIPGDREVDAGSDPTGVDFTIAAAAAQVTGHVRDEMGAPLTGIPVMLSRLDSTGSYPVAQFPGFTDKNGRFVFALGDSDIVAGSTWRLYARPWSADSATGVTTSQLAAVNEMQINRGDSLVKDLTIFSSDSLITGRVEIDGAAPDSIFEVAAENPDSAAAMTMTDSTGQFTLQVTGIIHNYNLFLLNAFPDSSFQGMTVHPGESGIVINIMTTGVHASGAPVPGKFELRQNYPNPFNPSTAITYELSTMSHVSLKVYDVLGRLVWTLVNKVERPGYHKVTFDGAGLASGVYFYRLAAGSNVMTKKMILLK